MCNLGLRATFARFPVGASSLQSLADKSFMSTLVPFRFNTPQTLFVSMTGLKSSSRIQQLCSFCSVPLTSKETKIQVKVLFIDPKPFRSNSACISSFHKGTSVKSSVLFVSFISFNKDIQVRLAVWWLQEPGTKQENSVFNVFSVWTVHSMKSSK